MLLTRIYEINASSITLIGVGAGLLSGLSYAVFIFGFKYAAPHGSPQAILVIAFTALVAMLIWPGETGRVVATLSTSSWLMLAALGIFGAGLSFVLYIVGLNHTTPAIASIVAMVEPVTASLFGVMVLGESLVGSQVVGMTLIIVTVTALSVHSSAS
jgi:drug/metabolite transporter (DMT)-like permease